MTTATAVRVEDLLAVAAMEIKESPEPVVLRDKAQEIVDTIRAEDPELLCDYFEDHAVTLLAQNLRIRLAEHRRRERKSIFEPSSVSEDHIPEDPFSLKLAVDGNVWKPIGDMTRPDWVHILENRTELAHASLFDIALAKAMIRKLPNDHKLTRDALTVEQLTRMQTTAENKAKNALKEF